MNCCFLIIVCATFAAVCALECGISSDHNQELKRVANVCMNENKKRWYHSQEQSKENSYEAGDESTEQDDDRRDLNKRNKRSSTNDGDSSDEDGHKESRSSPRQLITSGITDDCIIHCILGHFDIINESGFPDREKVSQGLLRNAEGRELKDFLRESTDECYQNLEQGDRMSSCSYSTELVKCLASKGKSNCSDWPTDDLPIAQYF